MSEKPLNLYGKFEAKVSSKLGSSRKYFMWQRVRQIIFLAGQRTKN